MTDLGVGSWPARRARITPDRIAFRQGERAVSYAELAERIDALAGAFAARGVGPGDRVAHVGPNDIATFETFFAAARLGAIFVPLNTRLAPPEIAYLVEDCAPRLLVYGAESAPLVDAVDGLPPLVAIGAVPMAPAPGVAGRSAPGLTVGAVPMAPAPGVAGRSAPGLTVGAAALVGAAESFEALIAEGRARPTVDVALEQDAVILYTSGTTGRPKGAVLTHNNLTFNVVNQFAHLDVLSTDVVLCTAPLFHATGLGQISLPALFKGGTVVVAPRFDPPWLLRTVGELGINAFSAVPTMLQMLVDHPDWDRADLHTLRYVNYGGSAVLERVARAWLARGVAVVQGYGMTEASPGVTMERPDRRDDEPVSAGVLHFFTDVALLDQAGTPVPPPGTGELAVRGPTVFRGYWNRPEDTRAVLVDGWLHSGDVVRLDADGHAHVVGRMKDLIISGGENIYPAEVEAAICALPEVLDAAVVAVPDERWGEVGAAYVIRRAGADLDGSSLRERLVGVLAKYKIPRHVRFVDELPRNATGKIRRADLRAAFRPEENQP